MVSFSGFFTESPGRGGWTRQLRRRGDRERAAGELLDGDAAAAHDTSSAQSPYFLAYQAAQVKLGDKGFLSRDITVLDLLMNRSDVHQLKGQGLSRGRYNQIANFVLAQSEINIAVGDKAPEKYFAELAEQVQWREEEVRRHHQQSGPVRQPPRKLCSGIDA